MVLSEFFFYFYLFFILPPPRFPDDNFWPPSRTAPEFKPVTCHSHRKKCIVFRPRATPGWGRGAPQTPQNPPPRKKKKNLCMRFRTPGTFLWKKKLVGKTPPAPPHIFFFFCVLRPQEHFLAEFFFSVKNSTSPSPTCTPPPSPQNTDPNPRAIINNPNNCSMTYTL